MADPVVEWLEARKANARASDAAAIKRDPLVEAGERLSIIFSNANTQLARFEFLTFAKTSGLLDDSAVLTGDEQVVNQRLVNLFYALAHAYPWKKSSFSPIGYKAEFTAEKDTQGDRKTFLTQVIDAYKMLHEHAHDAIAFDPTKHAPDPNLNTHFNEIQTTLADLRRANITGGNFETLHRMFTSDYIGALVAEYTQPSKDNDGNSITVAKDTTCLKRVKRLKAEITDILNLEEGKLVSVHSIKKVLPASFIPQPWVDYLKQAKIKLDEIENNSKETPKNIIPWIFSRPILAAARGRKLGMFIHPMGEKILDMLKSSPQKDKWLDESDDTPDATPTPKAQKTIPKNPPSKRIDFGNKATGLAREISGTEFEKKMKTDQSLVCITDKTERKFRLSLDESTETYDTEMILAFDLEKEDNEKIKYDLIHDAMAMITAQLSCDMQFIALDITPDPNFPETQAIYNRVMPDVIRLLEILCQNINADLTDTHKIQYISIGGHAINFTQDSVGTLDTTEKEKLSMYMPTSGFPIDTYLHTLNAETTLRPMPLSPPQR